MQTKDSGERGRSAESTSLKAGTKAASDTGSRPWYRSAPTGEAVFWTPLDSHLRISRQVPRQYRPHTWHLSQAILLGKEAVTPCIRPISPANSVYSAPAHTHPAPSIQPPLHVWIRGAAQQSVSCATRLDAKCMPSVCVIKYMRSRLLSLRLRSNSSTSAGGILAGGPRHHTDLQNRRQGILVNCQPFREYLWLPSTVNVVLCIPIPLSMLA